MPVSPTTQQQTPLIGKICKANGMIGIRCKLPPAHAVRLEDFFRARYDKRRNVVASSTDPDEILEKRGIAQIATDADDATDTGNETDAGEGGE